MQCIFFNEFAADIEIWAAKKAKVVKDDPVSSDPESLNEEISNSDEKKAKDENKTKEKKPWKKMTKADWDRLENEAEVKYLNLMNVVP